MPTYNYAIKAYHQSKRAAAFLQAALNILNEKLDELSDRVISAAMHHGMANLPDVVLEQIMKESIYQDSKWRQAYRGEAKAITQLALVSRRFRDVAYASPRLWSKIGPKNSFPCVRRMLLMSKNSLLHIDLGGSEIRTHSQFGQDVQNPLQFGFGCDANAIRYALLTPHTDRFQTFILGDYYYADFQGVVDRFLALSPSLDFCNVRNIALPRFSPLNGARSDLAIINRAKADFHRLFKSWHFPRASKLLIHDIMPMPGTFTSCSKVFMRIFEPEYVDSKDFYGTLESLPTLHSLSVDLMYQENTEYRGTWVVPPDQVIDLPQLRYFSFKVFDCDHREHRDCIEGICEILRSLRIPNVQSMDFRFVYRRAKDLDFLSEEEECFFLRPEPYLSLRSFKFDGIIGAFDDADPYETNITGCISKYFPALEDLQLVLRDHTLYSQLDSEPLAGLQSLQAVTVYVGADVRGMVQFIKRLVRDKMLSRIDFLVDFLDAEEGHGLAEVASYIKDLQTLSPETEFTMREWKKESEPQSAFE